MPAFRIGGYFFEKWDGAPPQIPGQVVRNFTKPGANGTGQQILGIVGSTFESELTAWFGGGTQGFNFLNAKRAVVLYQRMRGIGPLSIVYGNINYAAMFRIGYTVDDATEIETRSNVRLMSSQVDYPYGASVRMRFRMTPHVLLPATR